MGDVINMFDSLYTWKEVFFVDSPCTTLRVYVDSRTGAGEIVQMNDEGETVRTPLRKDDVLLLMAALHNGTP